MLTEKQLAWCREKLPAFAPAERDVMRRDESSKETYRIQGVYPGEVVGVYIETCPTLAAATCRPTSHLLPAERLQRHNRIGTQA